MKRILAGPNAVTEALRAAPKQIEMILLADGLQENTANAISDLARKSGTSLETVSRTTLDAMAKGLNHQGILAITGEYPFVDLDRLLELAGQREHPLLLVLDQIQDPGNLGAIVRSACSLGAAGVIITKDRSATMTSAAVRSSAGASELTRIARVSNLVQCLDALKNGGYRIYGAAGEATTPISRIDWTGKSVLVLGNEGKGLRRLTRENCDTLFAIPMAGGFESLNVSAAAAICLYEATRNKNV